MSPNKAVPILVWHAVLHGMWTLLIFSALAAILPSSTQSPAEFWYWLLPLSFILIHTLAYVGFILSRQESFAVQADPQWLIIFTFIIYIIQALLSSSISKTMWIPQPLGYVSISLVPIFLLLQSTTMTAWLDRRIIYDVLEKSTLPLQETLRKDQSLVQKAWYTIQGLQGKNFWILISGITLYGLSFIGSERLLPLFAGLLILISFLMCAHTLVNLILNHT